METAVVVGAGAGVGNAVARKLASEGYNVVLGARRADKLAEYAAQLAEEGVEVGTQVMLPGIP